MTREELNTTLSEACLQANSAWTPLRIGAPVFATQIRDLVVEIGTSPEPTVIIYPKSDMSRVLALPTRLLSSTEQDLVDGKILDLQLANF